MKQEFNLLKQSRQNIISTIATLNNEQLNRVPVGFNNNIIWNVGHVLVTQQILCYKFAGLEVTVPEELINKYRKGTKPEDDESQEYIEWIIKQLLPNASKGFYERCIYKIQCLYN